MARTAKHDWPMVRLGDVCHIEMGQAPKSEFTNERGEGVPLIAGAGDFTSTGLSAKKYTSRPTKTAEPGDLVLSIRATIGPFRTTDAQCVLGRGVAGLRAKNGLDAKFLPHLLTFLTPALQKKGKGATFLQVSKRDISELEFRLPPLDEQRRIAAILDQVDSALVRIDQSLAGLLQLKQELFTASFLEDQRESITVGEYLESTQYGTSDKANENVGIPVLRMGNVSYNGEIELSDLKYVELDIKDREKYSLKAGDLLFNRTNSKDLVGKTAVVPALPEEYTYAGYLIRCRVNDKAVPEYISGYLNSVLGKKILRNTAKAIVGMANINANELKRLPIPKASLDEQQEFASSTSRIEDVESQMKRQKKLLQELQESLSARAFQGGL